MGSWAGEWATAAAIVVGAAAIAPPVAPDETVRPCRPGTSAHAAASRALETLDGDIRKLPPAADPGPLARRLEALGQSGCFRILGGLGADAKSGLALRTWWEHGGHALVASALDLGRADPIVWVAPDVRRALTRETAPGHRLAPLLCRAYDDTCGRDTDGWRLRAEAALERGARIRNLQGEGFKRTLADWKHERAPTDDDCAVYARKAPRQRKLTWYQRCLDATAQRRPAFPIGRVGKPTDGWLVVSGRRGHYSFCDELRAFDLATGSSFRVASCSDLALQAGGAVDQRATDAGRRLERERGTVSLDAIREAAWMLLQLGELDEAVLTEGFGQALPEGIAVESDAGQYAFGLSSRSISMSSGDTTLAWRVTSGPGELGSGALTWPRDLNDDARAYAAELLEVAEASFTAGCPPATPPVALAPALGWGELLRESCPSR